MILNDEKLEREEKRNGWIDRERLVDGEEIKMS